MTESRIQMLTMREVLDTIGIRSNTTLNQMIRRDGFPKPYIISQGKRHWVESEVQAWIRRKMDEQRQSA